MYMEALAEKRKDSKGNYGNWDSTIKHLKKYCPRDIQFSQINKAFVDGFRDYRGRSRAKAKNNFI